MSSSLGRSSARYLNSPTVRRSLHSTLRILKAIGKFLLHAVIVLIGLFSQTRYGDRSKLDKLTVGPERRRHRQMMKDARLGNDPIKKDHWTDTRIDTMRRLK